MTGDLPANSPFQNAYILEVYKTYHATNAIKQVATRWAVSGESAFRTLYSNTWIEWSHYAVANNFRFVTGAELSVLKSLDEFMVFVPRNCILKMLNSNATERKVLVDLGLLPFTNSGFLTITRNNSDYITLEYISFGNIRQQAVISNGKLSTWA